MGTKFSAEVLGLPGNQEIMADPRVQEDYFSPLAAMLGVCREGDCPANAVYPKWKFYVPKTENNLGSIETEWVLRQQVVGWSRDRVVPF